MNQHDHARHAFSPMREKACRQTRHIASRSPPTGKLSYFCNHDTDNSCKNKTHLISSP